MKITTLSKLAIAVGLGAVCAIPSFAQPVTTWDYSQELEFVDPVLPPSVRATGTSGSNVAGNTKLDWGTPKNDQNKVSSLVINPTGDPEIPSGDLTEGSINTSFDINALTFAAGPVVVHNNFVITSSADALDSTGLKDYVALTPTAGDDGQGIQVNQVDFSVNFQETPNNQDPCSANGNPGDFPVGLCGDILVLTGGELGAPTIVNNDELAFLIDSFVRGGYLYEVFLREATNAFIELTDAACQAAGADDGCLGFTTAKNESNIFALEFAILATERIPAPATLGLLGASLLSMVWMRRRKGGRAQS